MDPQDRSIFDLEIDAERAKRFLRLDELRRQKEGFLDQSERFLFGAPPEPSFSRSPEEQLSHIERVREKFNYLQGYLARSLEELRRRGGITDPSAISDVKQLIRRVEQARTSELPNLESDIDATIRRVQNTFQVRQPASARSEVGSADYQWNRARQLSAEGVPPWKAVEYVPELAGTASSVFQRTDPQGFARYARTAEHARVFEEVAAQYWRLRGKRLNPQQQNELNNAERLLNAFRYNFGDRSANIRSLKNIKAELETLEAEIVAQTGLEPERVRSFAQRYHHIANAHRPTFADTRFQPEIEDIRQGQRGLPDEDRPGFWEQAESTLGVHRDFTPGTERRFSSKPTKEDDLRERGLDPETLRLQTAASRRETIPGWSPEFPPYYLTEGERVRAARLNRPINRGGRRDVGTIRPEKGLARAISDYEREMRIRLNNQFGQGWGRQLPVGQYSAQEVASQDFTNPTYWSGSAVESSVSKTGGGYDPAEAFERVSQRIRSTQYISRLPSGELTGIPAPLWENPPHQHKWATTPSSRTQRKPFGILPTISTPIVDSLLQERAPLRRMWEEGTLPTDPNTLNDLVQQLMIERARADFSAERRIKPQIQPPMPKYASRVRGMRAYDPEMFETVARSPIDTWQDLHREYSVTRDPSDYPGTFAEVMRASVGARSTYRAEGFVRQYGEFDLSDITDHFVNQYYQETSKVPQSTGQVYSFVRDTLGRGDMHDVLYALGGGRLLSGARQLRQSLASSISSFDPNPNWHRAPMYYQRGDYNPRQPFYKWINTPQIWKQTGVAPRDSHSVVSGFTPFRNENEITLSPNLPVEPGRPISDQIGVEAALRESAFLSVSAVDLPRLQARDIPAQLRNVHRSLIPDTLRGLMIMKRQRERPTWPFMQRFMTFDKGWMGSGETGPRGILEDTVKNLRETAMHVSRPERIAGLEQQRKMLQAARAHAEMRRIRAEKFLTRKGIEVDPLTIENARKIAEARDVAAMHAFLEKQSWRKKVAFRGYFQAIAGDERIGQLRGFKPDELHELRTGFITSRSLKDLHSEWGLPTLERIHDLGLDRLSIRESEEALAAVENELKQSRNAQPHPGLTQALAEFPDIERYKEWGQTLHAIFQTTYGKEYYDTPNEAVQERFLRAFSSRDPEVIAELVNRMNAASAEWIGGGRLSPQNIAQVGEILAHVHEGDELYDPFYEELSKALARLKGRPIYRDPMTNRVIGTSYPSIPRMDFVPPQWEATMDRIQEDHLLGDGMSFDQTYRALTGLMAPFGNRLHEMADLARPIMRTLKLIGRTPRKDGDVADRAFGDLIRWSREGMLGTALREGIDFGDEPATLKPGIQMMPPGSDIFKSVADALVNPVNTVGTMGAGLAKEFATRFPGLEERYQRAIRSGDFGIGKVLPWMFKEEDRHRYVMNVPTKKHWRDPSQLSYVEEGLKALREEIARRNLRHVAVPALGAGLGGLPWEEVLPLIQRHLGDLEGTQVDVYPPGKDEKPAQSASSSSSNPRTGFYTGVGSRDTPPEIQNLMTKFAQQLAEAGYTLRSGHAQGADQAFERGAGKKSEIYLPWEGFEKQVPILGKGFLAGDVEEARAIAKQIHPNWGALTRGGEALHTRNIFQVLGQDLETPSDFLVAWTKGGEDVGGTATALRLARERGIPTFNLGNETQRKIIEEAIRDPKKFLGSLGKTITFGAPDKDYMRMIREAGRVRPVREESSAPIDLRTQMEDLVNSRRASGLSPPLAAMAIASYYGISPEKILERRKTHPQWYQNHIQYAEHALDPATSAAFYPEKGEPTDPIIVPPSIQTFLADYAKELGGREFAVSPRVHRTKEGYEMFDLDFLSTGSETRTFVGDLPRPMMLHNHPSGSLRWSMADRWSNLIKGIRHGVERDNVLRFGSFIYDNKRGRIRGSAMHYGLDKHGLTATERDIPIRNITFGAPDRFTETLEQSPFTNNTKRAVAHAAKLFPELRDVAFTGYDKRYYEENGLDPDNMFSLLSSPVVGYPQNIWAAPQSQDEHSFLRRASAVFGVPRDYISPSMEHAFGLTHELGHQFTTRRLRSPRRIRAFDDFSFGNRVSALRPKDLSIDDHNSLEEHVYRKMITERVADDFAAYTLSHDEPRQVFGLRPLGTTPQMTPLLRTLAQNPQEIESLTRAFAYATSPSIDARGAFTRADSFGPDSLAGRYSRFVRRARGDRSITFGAPDDLRGTSIPSRLYHGTNRAFDRFDLDKAMEFADAQAISGHGAYFTDSEEAARAYAKIRANTHGGEPRLVTAELDPRASWLDIRGTGNRLPRDVREGWRSELIKLLSHKNTTFQWMASTMLDNYDALGDRGHHKGYIGPFDERFRQYMLGRGIQGLIAGEGGERGSFRGQRIDTGEYDSYLAYDPSIIRRMTNRPLQGHITFGAPDAEPDPFIDSLKNLGADDILDAEGRPEIPFESAGGGGNGNVPPGAPPGPPPDLPPFDPNEQPPFDEEPVGGAAQPRRGTSSSDWNRQIKYAGLTFDPDQFRIIDEIARSKGPISRFITAPAGAGKSRVLEAIAFATYQKNRKMKGGNAESLLTLAFNKGTANNLLERFLNNPEISKAITDGNPAVRTFHSIANQIVRETMLTAAGFYEGREFTSSLSEGIRQVEPGSLANAPVFPIIGGGMRTAILDLAIERARRAKGQKSLIRDPRVRDAFNIDGDVGFKEIMELMTLPRTGPIESERSSMERALGEFKQGLLDPSDVLANLNLVREEDRPKAESAAHVYAEYEKIMDSLGHYDHDDTIKISRQIMRLTPEAVAQGSHGLRNAGLSDPEFQRFLVAGLDRRERWEGRVPNLNIDEAQGLYPGILDLAMRISSPEGQKTLTGDAKQNNSGFLGALGTPQRIAAAFEAAGFPTMEIRNLIRNYRSGRHIVNFASRISGRNEIAMQPHLGEIIARSYKTRADEERAIAQLVLKDLGPYIAHQRELVGWSARRDAGGDPGERPTLPEGALRPSDIMITASTDYPLARLDPEKRALTGGVLAHLAQLAQEEYGMPIPVNWSRSGSVEARYETIEAAWEKEIGELMSREGISEEEAKKLHPHPIWGNPGLIKSGKGVRIGNVHKVLGSEANKAYLMDMTYGSVDRPWQNDGDEYSAKNMMYTLATRPSHTLHMSRGMFREQVGEGAEQRWSNLITRHGEGIVKFDEPDLVLEQVAEKMTEMKKTTPFMIPGGEGDPIGVTSRAMSTIRGLQMLSEKHNREFAFIPTFGSDEQGRRMITGVDISSIVEGAPGSVKVPAEYAQISDIIGHTHPSGSTFEFFDEHGDVVSSRDALALGDMAGIQGGPAGMLISGSGGAAIHQYNPMTGMVTRHALEERRQKPVPVELTKENIRELVGWMKQAIEFDKIDVSKVPGMLHADDIKMGPQIAKDTPDLPKDLGTLMHHIEAKRQGLPVGEGGRLAPQDVGPIWQRVERQLGAMTGLLRPSHVGMTAIFDPDILERVQAERAAQQTPRPTTTGAADGHGVRTYPVGMVTGGGGIPPIIHTSGGTADQPDGKKRTIGSRVNAFSNRLQSIGYDFLTVGSIAGQMGDEYWQRAVGHDLTALEIFSSLGTRGRENYENRTRFRHGFRGELLDDPRWRGIDQGTAQMAVGEVTKKLTLGAVSGSDAERAEMAKKMALPLAQFAQIAGIAPEQASELIFPLMAQFGKMPSLEELNRRDPDAQAQVGNFTDLFASYRELGGSPELLANVGKYVGSRLAQVGVSAKDFASMVLPLDRQKFTTRQVSQAIATLYENMRHPSPENAYELRRWLGPDVALPMERSLPEVIPGSMRQLAEQLLPADLRALGRDGIPPLEVIQNYVGGLQLQQRGQQLAFQRQTMPMNFGLARLNLQSGYASLGISSMQNRFALQNLPAQRAIAAQQYGLSTFGLAEQEEVLDLNERTLPLRRQIEDLDFQIGELQLQIRRRSLQRSRTQLAQQERDFERSERGIFFQERAIDRSERGIFFQERAIDRAERGLVFQERSIARSEAQLGRSEAGLNFNLAMQALLYGTPNQQAALQIAGLTWDQANTLNQRSALTANLPPPVALSATGDNYGLAGEQFVAGLQHQRSQIVLGRSALLSGAQAKEQLDYLEKQKEFFERSAQIQEAQRAFQEQQAREELAAQREAIADQKEQLGLQREALADQRAQLDLQREAIADQRAQLELQKEALADQRKMMELQEQEIADQEEILKLQSEMHEQTLKLREEERAFQDKDMADRRKELEMQRALLEAQYTLQQTQFDQEFQVLNAISGSLGIQKEALDAQSALLDLQEKHEKAILELAEKDLDIQRYIAQLLSLGPEGAALKGFLDQKDFKGFIDKLMTIPEGDREKVLKRLGTEYEGMPVVQALLRSQEKYLTDAVRDMMQTEGGQATDALYGAYQYGPVGAQKDRITTEDQVKGLIGEGMQAMFEQMTEGLKKTIPALATEDKAPSPLATGLGSGLALAPVLEMLGLGSLGSAGIMKFVTSKLGLGALGLGVLGGGAYLGLNALGAKPDPMQLLQALGPVGAGAGAIGGLLSSKSITDIKDQITGALSGIELPKIDLGSIFTEFDPAALAGSVGGALAGVWDTAKQWWEETVKPWWSDLWSNGIVQIIYDAMPAPVKAVWDWLKGIKGSGAMGEWAEGLKAWWSELWSTTIPGLITGAIESVRATAASFVSGIFGESGAINSWWDTLSTWWGTLWNETIPGLVGGASESVRTQVNAFVAGIFGEEGAINTWWGGLEGFWNTLWVETIPGLISGGVEAVWSKASEFVGKIWGTEGDSAIGSWWSGLSSWWSNLWGGTEEGSLAGAITFTGVGGKVEEFFKGISDKVGEWSKKFGGFWEDLWKKDLPGIISGESSAGDLIGNVRGYLKNIFGSGEVHEWAEDHLKPYWSALWSTDIPALIAESGEALLSTIRIWLDHINLAEQEWEEPFLERWAVLWMETIPSHIVAGIEPIGGATGLVTGTIQGIFNGWWESFKSWFDGVVIPETSARIAAISGQLDHVKGLAEATKGAIDAIPTEKTVTVTTVHKTVYEYSTSEQPYAHGGIVDRPTRALLGEMGPEAVVPLEPMKMRRFMSELARNYEVPPAYIDPTGTLQPGRVDDSVLAGLRGILSELTGMRLELRRDDPQSSSPPVEKRVEVNINITQNFDGGVSDADKAAWQQETIDVLTEALEPYLR